MFLCLSPSYCHHYYFYQFLSSIILFYKELTSIARLFLLFPLIQPSHQSDRVRAATRSTTTGRIPLSSDYVIEARLSSDESEGEEEQSVCEAESIIEGAAQKNLSVENLKLNDTETSSLLG